MEIKNFQRTFERIMNTKKPSQKTVITCQSREQLRDASSIIRKIASDIAFIREVEITVTTQGLDAEAEDILDIITFSPSGSGLSEVSSLMDLMRFSPSGSGLGEVSSIMDFLRLSPSSGLSSPLQLGWRSEASDASPTSTTSGRSLEDSASSNIEQEDEGYDADISSNCDHSASEDSV